MSTTRSTVRWLGAVAALALANVLAGRLGLMLAVPPGHATAFFPPAGIALAALLLGGNRLWPGVFIGSVLLTLTGAGPTTPLATALACAVAAGSTLQAFAGAWMVRRWVGFPTSLDDDLAVGKLLVLGGPVGCLIAPTFGVAALSQAGVLTTDHAFNWFTWWIGDSIGVLIATPLMLIAFARPRELWRARWLSVGVPLGFASLAAVAVFVSVSAREQALLEREFRDRTTTLTLRIGDTIDRAVDALWELRINLSVAQAPQQASFRAMARGALAENPALHGLTWNPVVTADRRPAFVGQARREVAPGFEIRPAATSGPSVPALWVEPHGALAAVEGYDFAAEAGWRGALESARDSGRPRSAGPSVGLAGMDVKPGPMIFVPIYERDRPLENFVERRAALRGYLTAGLELESIVDTALATAPRGDVELRMTAADDPGARPLYGPADEAVVPFEQRTTLRIAGRTWDLQFTPTPDYHVGRAWRAWTGPALGMLLTSLIGFALLSATGRSGRIEQLVRRRTDELRRSEEQMKADEVFLRRLLDLQEKERRMVAYDIHDGFVQDVVGARMQVESIRSGASPEAIRATLDKVDVLLGRAIAEARRMVRDLRPMALDEMGIVDAIDHLVHEMREHGALRVEFVHDADLGRLHPTLEGAVFRVVQEALNNVRRHAATDRVLVRVTRVGTRLELEVRDEGAGFDPGRVGPRCMGLRGIRERARLIGGRSTIDSAPGRGTVVRAELPLVAASGDDDPSSWPGSS